MSFTGDIIQNIKTIAELTGDADTIKTLGNTGEAWTTGGGLSMMETLIEGYAIAIENRKINHYPPFNGQLTKEITQLVEPDIVITEEAFGLVTGDTFYMTGSTMGHNGVFTITGINGNTCYITGPYITGESFSPALKQEIDPPAVNLNIEQTLAKVQADVYDAIPKVATTLSYGTVKKAAAVQKFQAYTTDATEIKVNELIDALRNAGSMSTS